jgi:uncharacterized integral membrane protein
LHDHTVPRRQHRTGAAIRSPAPRRPPAQQAAKRTRISAVWVVLALFDVVLLPLLVFILENSQRVDISYFGAHGHLPLGVALLLAAVPGSALTVIAVRARSADPGCGSPESQDLKPTRLGTLRRSPQRRLRATRQAYRVRSPGGQVL